MSAAMISGGGKIRAFFQRVVFQPEDVEVHLVAFRQLFVGEGFETIALLPVVAVHRVVAGYEGVEVAALEGVFLEGEMQIGAQVVDPDCATR